MPGAPLAVCVGWPACTRRLLSWRPYPGASNHSHGAPSEVPCGPSCLTGAPVPGNYQEMVLVSVQDAQLSCLSCLPKMT